MANNEREINVTNGIHITAINTQLIESCIIAEVQGLTFNKLAPF